MSLNVKQGDTVVVIAGKDKGKTGKVLSANPKANTVIVDNVNIVTKHRKPRGAQQPGGKSKEPAAIDVSNVQIICPSCGKATRVKAGEADGKKIRVCGKKDCGASLDVKTKADKKKKSAKKEDKPVEAAEEKKTAKKTKKAKEETAAETADATPKAKKPAAKKTADAAASETESK